MKEKDNINFLGSIAKPYIEKISNVIEKIIIEDLSNEKSGYRPSTRAIPIFAIRILKISTGIIDLILADNIYCSNALLRTLVEHSFKISYLTKKSIEDNNGDVFEDYYLFCDFAEELQYQKNLDYRTKTLFNLEFDEKAYKKLINSKPEIKNYSKRKIFEKANEFSFRNIFKFINEKQEEEYKSMKDEYLKKCYGSFLMIGAEYSDLSSFIHGGPFAESYVFPFKERDNHEILNIIETVMIMHFYGNLSILEFWNKLNPKYDKEIMEIIGYMNEYYKKV